MEVNNDKATLLFHLQISSSNCRFTKMKTCLYIFFCSFFSQGDIATCAGTYLYAWSVNGQLIAKENTSLQNNNHIQCCAMSEVRRQVVILLIHCLAIILMSVLRICRFIKNFLQLIIVLFFVACLVDNILIL